jgi:hypothetical protein
LQASWDCTLDREAGEILTDIAGTFGGSHRPPQAGGFVVGLCTISLFYDALNPHFVSSLQPRSSRLMVSEHFGSGRVGIIDEIRNDRPLEQRLGGVIH